MDAKKITRSIRRLYKIRPKRIPKYIIRNLTVISESIDTEIGLYQAVRLSSLGWWEIFLTFPLALWLSLFVRGGCVPPPQYPSLVYMLFCVLSLYLVIGLGCYITFILPVQPYFILKFSKKKGKELANLIETYSAYNFIIMIIALILLPIAIILSGDVLNYIIYYGKYTAEVFFLFVELGHIALFVIYLFCTPISMFLTLNYLAKWWRTEFIWFDELKARIEMKEEKQKKDNLGVGER